MSTDLGKYTTYCNLDEQKSICCHSERSKESRTYETLPSNVSKFILQILHCVQNDMNSKNKTGLLSL
ncbi:hypothetical protein SRABI36_01149 [Pedobacter sp. Bi36]|nr:hypothetical protein SRABI36_01149 [Pedobacter sp. Bi36]CAH0222429.1 hypothetical protein SRABI126_02241 [Pedobacter sp. Bi126]